MSEAIQSPVTSVDKGQEESMKVVDKIAAARGRRGLWSSGGLRQLHGHYRQRGHCWWGLGYGRGLGDAPATTSSQMAGEQASQAQHQESVGGGGGGGWSFGRPVAIVVIGQRVFKSDRLWTQQRSRWQALLLGARWR